MCNRGFCFPGKIHLFPLLTGCLTGVLLIAGTAAGQPSATIVKSGPTAAQPGDLLTYTITYSNTGSTLLNNGIIEDLLPAGDFTYVSSSPEGDTGTAGKIVWTQVQIPELASLDAGSHTVTVVLRAGQLQTGPAYDPSGYYIGTSPVNIENQATIRFDEIPAPVYSNTLATTITQVCGAELSGAEGIIKSATNSVFIYRIAITNTGNVYNRWNLSDYFSSGQTLLTSYAPVGGTAYTETLQSPWLAPGETWYFLFRLVSPQGTNPNQSTYPTVVATPVVPGCTPASETYETYICGGGPACESYNLLSVYKIDTPDPVRSGETLTYRIVVYNGNDPGSTNPGLSDVRLTDTLPPELLFISSDPAYTAVSGNVYTWDIALLPPGDYLVDVTVTVAGDLPDGTLLVNRNAVSNGGTVYAESAQTTTVRSAPDLYVRKTASPGTGDPGELITYAIEWRNNGNRTAPAAEIRDNYSETYMDAVNLGGGANSVPAGEVTWSLGDLAPGASGSISYTLQVKSDPGLFPAGTTNAGNSALISCGLADDNPNDNQSSALVQVRNLPDLTVTKTASPDPGRASQPLTYTLTVGNASTAGHTGNYTVTDELPPGALFGEAPGGSYDPLSHTVTWTLAEELPAGGVRSLTLTLGNLGCGLIPAGLANRAAVASATFADKNPDDNEFLLQTAVEDREAPATESCPVPITTGNDPGICGAVVDNAMPAFSDNCAGSGLQGTMTGGVAPGGLFPPGVTTVTWSYSDPAGNGPATCSFTVTVDPCADLSVTAGAAPDPVLKGGLLTYEVIVTNEGPSEAAGVQLAAVLDAALSAPEYAMDGGGWAAFVTPLSLGSLAPGAQVTVKIRGTVGCQAPESLSSLFSVSAATQESGTANNSATEVTATEVLTAGPVTPGQELYCAGFTGYTFAIDELAGASGYSWALPAGSAVTAGQGTASIVMTAGNTGGAVCVTPLSGGCPGVSSCLDIILLTVPGKPVRCYNP